MFRHEQETEKLLGKMDDVTAMLGKLMSKDEAEVGRPEILCPN